MNIAPSMGKLEGRGEVRGPDGKLKFEFVLTSDCSPEQAEKLGLPPRSVAVEKEKDHGGDTPGIRT